jgi:hypothetical protein
MTKLSDRELRKKCFVYLDELRESGDINMFAAAPRLALHSGLSVRDSSKILVEWMRAKDQSWKI